MLLAISLSMESDIIFKNSFWESGWVYFPLFFVTIRLSEGRISMHALAFGQSCLLYCFLVKEDLVYSKIVRSQEFVEASDNFAEIISETLRFVSRTTSTLSASLWHFDFSCAWNFFTVFFQFEKPSVRKAPSFLFDSLRCPDRLCDLHIEQRTTSFSFT